MLPVTSALNCPCGKGLSRSQTTYGPLMNRFPEAWANLPVPAAILWAPWYIPPAGNLPGGFRKLPWVAVVVKVRYLEIPAVPETATRWPPIVGSTRVTTLVDILQNT